MQAQEQRLRAAAQAYDADPHPVEQIQKNWLENQLNNNHTIATAIHGHSLAMQLKMEQHILAQCKRLPCHPSSMIGLNTVLNRDERIDFEDYLGGKKKRPNHLNPALIPTKSPDQPNTHALLF